MAEKIVEGIRLADSDVEVKVFNLTKSDQNNLITEVFKSKIVLMGSPTIGGSILHSIADFIHLMKELEFKNKKAAFFGCYGRSGESVKVLNELLVGAGFEIMNEGFRNLWNPDEEQQQDAIEFGKKLLGANGKNGDA